MKKLLLLKLWLVLIFLGFYQKTTAQGCDGMYADISNEGSLYSFSPLPMDTSSSVSYIWDFGDGSYEYFGYATHEFQATGTYTITLYKFTPIDTCIVDTTVNVIGLKNCSVFIDYTNTYGSTVILSGYNYNNQDSGTYSWNIAGDTTTYTGDTLKYTFPTGGYHNVTLRFNGTYTCDTVQEIYVGGPCDDFYIYSNVYKNQANLTAYGVDPTSTLQWDFGDGESLESGVEVFHTYPNVGDYIVIASLTSGASFCSDTLLVPIYDTTSACNAAFASYQSGTQVSFYPEEANFNASYNWDFGNGTTSTEMYPSEILFDPGEFLVSLTVTFGGNSCTYQDTILVQTCDISIQSSKLSENTYHFIASNSGTSTNGYYSWSFNDIGYGTGKSFNYTFPDTGQHYAIVYYYNEDYTCFSEDTLEIYVNSVPTTVYTLSGQVQAGNALLDMGYVNIFDLQNGYYGFYRQYHLEGGDFSFEVPAGNYLVYALPNINSVYFDSYLPTYYGDSLNWYNTSVLNLNSNTNITINLTPFTSYNFTGTNRIEGKVTFAASVFERSTAGEDAIENTVVTLYSATGDRLTSTYTDPFGNYSFENVDAGSEYNIEYEYPGTNGSSRVTTTTGEEGTTTTVNSDLSIVSGISRKNLTVNYINVNSYPNPSTDHLFINIPSEETGKSYNISISDELGKTVFNKDEVINNSNIMLTTSDLKNGFYIVQIKTGEFVYRTKFIKK